MEFDGNLNEFLMVNFGRGRFDTKGGVLD